jgi:hypothetical protein
MNLEFKTHITIPRQPREGLALLAWAKDVNYAIRQLANISSSNIPYKTPKGISIGDNTRYIHPWKCKANGDATIYVGEGRIHSYLDGETATLASISMAGFGDWEGGNVTVTAATGVIYGEIAATSSNQALVEITADSNGESGDVNITLLRTMPDTLAYITVGFAETLPKDSNANTFYWEIAQVALTDGIASITKQVLRHDPMLWSFTQSS